MSSTSTKAATRFDLVAYATMIGLLRLSKIRGICLWISFDFGRDLILEPDPHWVGCRRLRLASGKVLVTAITSTDLGQDGTFTIVRKDGSRHVRDRKVTRVFLP